MELAITAIIQHLFLKGRAHKVVPREFGDQFQVIAQVVKDSSLFF